MGGRGRFMNDTAHLCMHVVPRTPGVNLSLLWPPA